MRITRHGDGPIIGSGTQPLTLYKRWTLRPGVTDDDVRRFVEQRILPAYRRLSSDVELGLELATGGGSIVAVQRWSSVAAHQSASTGPAFETWWAGYMPTLIDWDRMVTFDHEWSTHPVFFT